MKRIYYKRLIADRQHLSAAERIVYSFLVYQSLCNLDDAWDKETGKFDKTAIKEYGDCFALPDFCFEDNKFVYGSKIAKYTGVSQATVSRAVRKLADVGLIDWDCREIKHNDIYEDGFFTLDDKVKLTGELLIFYSWLLYLKKDGKFIFATRNKLATNYHVKAEDVRDYIARLKDEKLAERDENGNLIIK